MRDGLIEKYDGIYCAICGTKTYLAADGSHRRCPNCDDLDNDRSKHYTQPSYEITWDNDAYCENFRR